MVARAAWRGCADGVDASPWAREGSGSAVCAEKTAKTPCPVENVRKQSRALATADAPEHQSLGSYRTYMVPPSPGVSKEGSQPLFGVLLPRMLCARCVGRFSF